MAVALAVGLFVVVLALVIIQPRGLSIGWTALGGGILALGLGIVSWANVDAVVHIVWDATLTFVAIILISLVLDAIGFFQWAALHMARLSRGSGLKLFLLLTLLGAGVAMFFANDGAALILTPIVYEQTKVLKLDYQATLALVMASGFIADTTSLPLVVSNLVNIVSANFFHLGFASFAVRMVPVDLVAFLASVLALYVLYRRTLPKQVEVASLDNPASAIRDPKVFRAAWWILAFLLMGYFASQALNWPIAVFAGLASVSLLAMARKSPVVRIRHVIKEAPWKIVVFSVGMYVVVFGLRNVGLTHILSELLSNAADHGPLAATMSSGLLAAGLSSVMNNMPSVMINALSIHDTGVALGLKTAMAYANVVGCDLGPKITPIGSLATLLWLHVLERRGIRITWGYYFRVGIMMTVPVLLITLAALWAWSAVVA